jgi:hypothetical protein
MKANEIKDELDRTISRITELETERERQTEAFEAVQEAFIKGEIDSGRLHEAQNKQTLTRQAIESLRGVYQRLKSAFENQPEVEARPEQIKQMARLANEIEIERGEYVDTRENVNQLIADSARRLLEKKTNYQAKQRRYQDISSALGTLTNEEIQTAGVSDEARRIAGAGYFNEKPLEYDRVIVLAEQTLTGKIHDAARAKRQAEANALRLERTAAN